MNQFEVFLTLGSDINDWIKRWQSLRGIAAEAMPPCNHFQTPGFEGLCLICDTKRVELLEHAQQSFIGEAFEYFLPKIAELLAFNKATNDQQWVRMLVLECIRNEGIHGDSDGEPKVFAKKVWDKTEALLKEQNRRVIEAEKRGQ